MNTTHILLSPLYSYPTHLHTTHTISTISSHLLPILLFRPLAQNRTHGNLRPRLKNTVLRRIGREPLLHGRDVSPALDANRGPSWFARGLELVDWVDRGP